VRVLPRDRELPQHPQFMPCPARVLRGSLALRSFAACARFTAEDNADTAGAPPTIRSDNAPHCGQAAGSRHCANRRNAANAPQSAHA